MTDIADFTLNHYSKLLELAKAQYKFISYEEISFDQRFILWRHDCDFSLNRARDLARIEQEHNVSSTYFLNPHCEFYNLLEKDQAAIIQSILACGHNIGLHFDAAFYQTASEDQLDELVAKEAGWLKDWFGVAPTAFSFHNPDAFLLTCERNSYGGLANCYSRKFKERIPYCSDSNGYWRYRRLYDVLEKADEPCLQVLTHPGWWQEEPLYPRQRIFRSVYGRADAVMALYDNTLQTHGRDNLGGPAGSLAFLKTLDSEQYSLLDYLWNKQAFRILFLELWQMHEVQLRSLCKEFFVRSWRVPGAEANDFLIHCSAANDPRLVFERTFNIPWIQAISLSEDLTSHHNKLRQMISCNTQDIDEGELQKGCVYLCGVIRSMAQGGEANPKIHHDGIGDCVDNPSQPILKPAATEVTKSDWTTFKESF